MLRATLRSAFTLALCAFACACSRPYVGRDGTVSFNEKSGTHGASVLTANGVEYRDNRDMPTPILRRSPDEPFRAPVGFILPQDGRFTKTSRPTVLASAGLAIVLRPSDTRLPSWGGEVLVRVDIVAPATDGDARWGENVAILVDGDGPDVTALAGAAFAQLAGRDRVTLLDARDAHVIVPMMPASHRSMAIAALSHYLARGHTTTSAQAPRMMGETLKKAGLAIASSGVTQRVLVLGELPMGREELAETERLTQRGVQFGEVPTRATRPDDLNERLEAVRTLIPQAGLTKFRDVRLTFQGTPAPAHVIEASGGEARWALEAGELVLGNVRAGESRTEMIRVTVPPWVAGEAFTFTVSAHVDDLDYGGPRDFVADVPCVYDDDIERIAKSRNGDVIAYASAMASLRRLDAAFTGDDVGKVGGLRRIAELQASSMRLLARETKDAAMQEQADLLVALLSATGTSSETR